MLLLARTSTLGSLAMVVVVEFRKMGKLFLTIFFGNGRRKMYELEGWRRGKSKYGSVFIIRFLANAHQLSLHDWGSKLILNINICT
jgi:hypothetical protein